MKKVAFAFMILFVAVSCNKFEPTVKKGDHYVYNSDDFREANVTILGEESATMDAIWIELYYDQNPCATNDPDRYALVVKRDGELVKELGKITSDWQSYITFTPENGAAYTGTLDASKERITLTYELTNRTEEVSFVYKK